MDTDKVAYPQPHCPKCGQVLKLIESRWYCENCKIYLEFLPLSPISRYGTKKGKRNFLILFGVIIAIFVVIAIASISLTFSPLTSTPKITQVIIKVTYSGSWQGAYGDQTGVVSWSGQGTKTITLTRSSQATSFWIITANAQKMDDSGNTLTIAITKTDGTVLNQGSTTAAYGMAQIVYTVQP